jgi:hypothetical protein
VFIKTKMSLSEVVDIFGEHVNKLVEENIQNKLIFEKIKPASPEDIDIESFANSIVKKYTDQVNITEIAKKLKSKFENLDFPLNSHNELIDFITSLPDNPGKSLSSKEKKELKALEDEFEKVDFQNCISEEKWTKIKSHFNEMGVCQKEYGSLLDSTRIEKIKSMLTCVRTELQTQLTKINQFKEKLEKL